jgi:hypothetical protein
MRKVFIWGYVIIAFAFAIYGNWWGDHAHRSFAYNLGLAIVWPIDVIPGLGTLVSIVAVLGILGFVLTRKP